MKVGIIGLGAMGFGMASNLANAGYLTAVYNRTTEKMVEFIVENLITAYPTPQSLAADVDVVILCVSADQDVLSVVGAIAETLRPGTVVVDTSTVSRDTAQTAARILASKQVAFLDAPISGGVEGAKNGILAMMVGGEADVLEKVRPVLETLATRIIHMGPNGAGQATKAVNQIMGAGINQAVTEALGFAEAQGLDMDKVIEVISGGASGNWFLQHRGATLVKGSFAPGFKVALHHKDLKICQGMAVQTDFPTPLVDMTVVNYQQLMNEGYGEEDISSLYRLKKPD